MENELEHKNNNEEQKMERDVMQEITSGKVKMRPRWQFVLTATLLGVGAVIVLLTLLYLVSFILFELHESGAWFVPNFGVPGWFAFFHRLPWVLIGFVALFVLVLEVLVRRYAFAYQRPLLASALWIMGIVLTGGAVISATHFQNQLFNVARRSGLPLIGGMYSRFGVPRFDDIRRGQILLISSDTLLIQDDDGDTSTIVITPGTRLPLGDGFSVGDTVVVFGPPGINGIVPAFGIQRVVE
jgi:hypothetical protein